MGSRREEEKNENIIRGLMKLPPNRKCINCNSVGPQFVCTNFWTFTCLSCSGIHREFTHRVKSVSMAKFTTQEVRALEQGGNQRARDIYLKDWDWQRMRLPDNSKPDRIREFIRSVYVDKKYAGGRSTNKPATDGESVQSSESNMRRPDSYHSYSQSPPYDFQYEVRRYGKKVDTLARRPSDRALFDGKLGSFLYSPGPSQDQMNEDRFANESYGSRFSDFSVSSTGDLKNDVLSPSSQDTGYSSPVHHSRNVSTENPQSHRHPNAASQIDFNGGPCSQLTASSGSFGSFDGSSASNKSVDFGVLPDAPTERPVHSTVNHQTGASSVTHLTQPFTVQHSTNSSVGVSTPSQESVQHGLVHMEAVVPFPVSAQPQPTAFTSQDLFDQSTMLQPFTCAEPIDLFAGFNQQTPPASHNVMIQKAVTPSPSVPSEVVTTSHPVDQDLFSLSILQEPAISSSPPSTDLFAGFDQQPPPTSSPHHITAASPLPGNEGWAFLGTPQHISSSSVSNVQVQVATVLPPNDGIAKCLDQSTLPTSLSNAVISRRSPPTMDQWSLNAEESWNVIGESTGSMPNNLFTFNTMSNTLCESTGSMPNNLFTFNTVSKVAPQQFTTPDVPYVESRTSEDMARGEPEKSTSENMFVGLNALAGHMVGTSFSAPLQPQLGGMVSQPGKSTNPFDIEANDLFMDLTSLQATLPDSHIPVEYSGIWAESWISQNSTVSYVPSGSHGGLSYMTGQVQDCHMLNATHGHFQPRNPFE